MNEDPLMYEKQLRFFKINPPKRGEFKKTKVKGLSFINPENLKIHEIIRQVLKDYQYFSGYEKKELNLSEGERVLKMNGIKIIRQNGTYFIQKYSTREQNIFKKPQKGVDKTEGIRVQFVKSQCITDPRYFLSQLGYTTKEANYFRYMDLQSYKCPGYGIEVVIYERRDDTQFMMIECVCNYEGVNVVGSILMEKLSLLVTQLTLIDIDPYTLRPKLLKHGVKPEQ